MDPRDRNECPDCEGTGEHPYDGADHDCPTCDGSGIKPADEDTDPTPYELGYDAPTLDEQHRRAWEMNRNSRDPRW